MNLSKPVTMAAISILALATLAGCGSDSTGKPVEQYCAIAMAAREVVLDDWATQALNLRDMADAAPSKQLAEDLGYMADMWENLVKIDPADSEALDAFFFQHQARFDEASARATEQTDELCY